MDTTAKRMYCLKIDKMKYFPNSNVLKQLTIRKLLSYGFSEELIKVLTKQKGTENDRTKFFGKVAATVLQRL